MSKIFTLIDNEVASIHLEFITDAEPYLHCELPNGITPSIYKWLVDFQEDLLVTLGVFGLQFVFTAVPSDNPMAIKFNHKMGYEDLFERDGFIYMVQDI